MGRWPQGGVVFIYPTNIDVTTVSVIAKSIFHLLKQSYLLYYLLKEIVSPKCRGRLYLAMTSALNNALWEFLSFLYKQIILNLIVVEILFVAGLRQAQTDNDKKIETESRTEPTEKHRKLLFQKIEN
ncbi:hypothetical protein [Pedobacter agri]|uniref:hypothetical protein n=1 Tax=Pedobacter agri TaxID=454586 RepID=UPI00029A6C20|nr:hypothetical protein [Pedobacter agri]